MNEPLRIESHQELLSAVIPAKAGIQPYQPLDPETWIPAFAGMTANNSF
ncbi:hypothetical protein [Azospirillum sp. Sh1]|nr:hypothetical protein [Azospirillum sp. Sh1]